MKMLSVFLSALMAVPVSCQQDPAKPATPAPVAGDPAGQPQGPQKPDAQKPDAEKLMQEVLQQFKKEGIVLDQKAQTVTITAVVNDPPDPLEYLLIHRRGKRHEAMFYTTSKPSVLNAALLMLGFTPGQNAKAEEIKPAPSIEEIEKGAETVKITPPKGMNLWMTAKWKTPEGKEVEYCIEDLLLDLATQEPVADCSWVFLGGRMAKFYKDEPEVFAADMEGNLVSTCYMYPENQLVTLSHERARDEHNWWMTTMVPPAETQVQFTFHRLEPQIHKDRAERIKKTTAEKQKQQPPQQGPEKGR